MKDRDKSEILLLMDKFVKNRSDSYSCFEKDFEKILINEIESIEFFKEQPELYGRSAIEGDEFGRSVVWALHQAHAEKNCDSVWTP